ncbi:MAG TPA: hypothetical protein VF054_04125 [Micromonosporaceae bacterium]
MTTGPVADHVALARRYRRLLLAYPPGWRAARGDEILGTLLDTARPGQRRPGGADVADLLAGAARAWLRTAHCDDLADGVAIAAPIALALAAGLSAALWLIVEPSGPATTAPIGYAGWLLAAVVWTALGPAPGRVAAAGALAATGLAVPAAAVTSAYRPPLWTVLTLTALGTLALGATGGGAPGRGRATVPLGALVAVGVFAVLPAAHRTDGYYQSVVVAAGTTVALAVAGTGAVAVVRAARRQPARPWLWASLLLALPGGWLGPEPARVWRFGLAGWCAPHFGRLSEVLLATAAVLVLVPWLRGTSTVDVESARTRLGRAGGVAVGCAGGLSLALGATMAVPALAGVTGAGEPPHGLLVTLALLGVVGTAAPPAPGRRAATVVAALGAVPATAAVLVYGSGWTIYGWHDFADNAELAGTLALIPFALAAVASVTALRAGPPRPRAIIVLLASVTWLGAATLPYLDFWGPVLLLLAVGGVTVTVCWPLLRPAGGASGSAPSTPHNAHGVRTSPPLYGLDDMPPV